jgi:aminoglycoside phosphotransferase
MGDTRCSAGRPATAQPEYGRHLGDIEYWSPQVRAVLRRHGLAADRIESGFVGTFPTFLAGNVVVKLFGDLFEGESAFATELATHAALAIHSAIPAPRLCGSGELFSGDGGWRWPYLVQERVGGRAWREASLTPGERHRAASRLGQVLAVVHRLPVPEAPRFGHGLLGRFRSGGSTRARGTGVVPERLVGQIDDFLADALPASVLVHADLTQDHVFVDGERLVGVIDWGDAMWADPFYELVALHFDCFRGDLDLLRTFLAAYGWPVGADFGCRVLQAVAGFQFNAWSRIATLVDLDRMQTLDQLADQLFAGLDKPSGRVSASS